MELHNCICDARNGKIIDISEMTVDDRDMMLAFARKLDTMDPEEKEKIRKLLSR